MQASLSDAEENFSELGISILTNETADAWSNIIPDVIRLSRGYTVRVATLNAEHGND